MIDSASAAVSTANDLAGLAALVNSLVLWPVVRSLQKAVDELKASGDKKRARRGR